MNLSPTSHLSCAILCGGRYLKVSACTFIMWKLLPFPQYIHGLSNVAMLAHNALALYSDSNHIFRQGIKGPLPGGRGGDKTLCCQKLYLQRASTPRFGVPWGARKHIYITLKAFCKHLWMIHLRKKLHRTSRIKDKIQKKAQLFFLDVKNLSKCTNLFLRFLRISIIFKELCLHSHELIGLFVGL